MPDLNAIRVEPAPRVYVPSLAALVSELVVSGHLCRCGDRVAAYGPDVAPYGPSGERVPVGTGLPPREDGSPRGRCQCFRARARQTPLDAGR